MPVKQTIEEGAVPVKVYTEDLEDSARQQLVNLSKLPIVHHHVAAMPDVHTGIGATVGSVIATKRAVIPAAVGVDIGCFTGDTSIRLVNDAEATLKELSMRGDEHWVYVIGAGQRVTGAKATARRTRTNAELMMVELDNDERIRCTPDHLFMLRDGTWCEAQYLRPGSSLMPLHTRKNAEGYTEVVQPGTDTYERFHWALARSGVLGPIPSFDGQRTVIHHKNFNEADNHPDNLQFMGDKDHSVYHRSLVERNTYWQSDAFEAQRKAALARKAKTPEGYAYFATRGTHNITRFMEQHRDTFLEKVAGNGKRGKRYLVAYNQSEKGRIKSARRRPAHEPHRGPQEIHQRRPRAADRGDRLPQGQRRRRRDPRRLQADRRGHAEPERSRRSGAHAEAGAVCEGLSVEGVTATERVTGRSEERR